MRDTAALRAAYEVFANSEEPFDLIAIDDLIGDAIKAYENALWAKPQDRLPEKPGKKSYEYVDCLIVYKGEVIQRPWNCEHLCFDDVDYDDFFCNAVDVDWWMPLPKAPDAKATQ